MNRQKKEELKRTQQQQGDHAQENHQQGSARQQSDHSDQQGEYPQKKQEAFRPTDTD